MQKNITKYIVKFKKKIYLCELANLMGGARYSSCEELQYAANTFYPPLNPSEEEQKAYDKFWKEWFEEYDRLCK